MYLNIIHNGKEFNTFDNFVDIGELVGFASSGKELVTCAFDVV